jgi:hypothetical protein
MRKERIEELIREHEEVTGKKPTKLGISNEFRKELSNELGIESYTLNEFLGLIVVDINISQDGIERMSVM